MTPVTKLRTFIVILCVTVLLLVCPVSSAGPVSAGDGSTTLRATTSASRSPFAQAEDVPDTFTDAAQPAWMGAIVLIFGGLLGGLWLFAGVLSVLRVLGDSRPRVEPQDLPPFSNRARKDETAPAEWL